MNNPATQAKPLPNTKPVMEQNPYEVNQQEPYVVHQISQTKPEKSTCVTLRNQFSFLWKLCLDYGICYLLFAYRNSDGIGSGIFAAISALFLLIIAKRLKDQPAEEEKPLSITISMESIFYFAAATLISIANCLTDNGFFLFFNHVGSFLLFSIACIKLFYNDKKWDFGKYTAILFSYWIQVFEVIPVPFQDWSFYHKKTDKKMSSTTRYVIIGIVVGIPILFITTLLLASADQIFSDMVEHIFNFDSILEWLVENLPQNIILLPCGFIVYTLLLYLVIGALCKGGLKEDVKEYTKFGTPIAVTIFVMIDIVYVLFSGIQFLFLFAGVPIAQHEYADYAREGFFELLFVALINFFLVLFCNKHFTKNTALKIVMTITSLCTFVMIASSAYRMQMYIHAYHLTFLRVFVLWFLLLLFFFMVGSTISIYRENWNSFRYCLFVLTCFYTVFALSNADGLIAKYNVAQFEKDLTDGGETPYLSDYLPHGYGDSKAYAVALSNLKKTYKEMLGDSNLYRIDSYFSLEDHFYEYDYNNREIDYGDGSNEDFQDYVLKKDAAIYDKSLEKSIFSWKHFNFVENACYRRCKEIN